MKRVNKRMIYNRDVVNQVCCWVTHTFFLSTASPNFDKSNPMLGYSDANARK